MIRGRWPWLAGAALVAFGAVSIAIGANNALRPEQSQDLAPVFRAARLWLAGANPYRPVDPDEWRATTHAVDVPDTPTGPDQSTIYSPVAVMNVAVVSGASWMTTKRLWLVLNLALAAYVPWLVGRLWYRQWPAALAWLSAGVWMGGMGLRIGLGNGQHALLWLSLILTSCGLVRSWPRAAGTLLALSVHKFNLTAILVPYFVARRAVLAMISAAVATVTALILFLVSTHAPAPEVVRSYARECSWLFGQSHGGTLPGRGLTDLYSILAGVLGEGRVASIASFALAAAGLVVTFLATSRDDIRPRDVDLAAWFLLVLWTTYHRAYDTVLLALPLAVLIDRAWRAAEVGRGWRQAWPVAVLALMWYVDPSKIYLLLHPTALDRMPESGALVVLETIYRIGILASWAYLVTLAARETRAASDAPVVQASPIETDKTPDGRLRRVTRVVAEGVTA